MNKFTYLFIIFILSNIAITANAIKPYYRLHYGSLLEYKLAFKDDRLSSDKIDLKYEDISLTGNNNYQFAILDIGYEINKENSIEVSLMHMSEIGFNNEYIFKKHISERDPKFTLDIDNKFRAESMNLGIVFTNPKYSPLNGYFGISGGVSLAKFYFAYNANKESKARITKLVWQKDHLGISSPYPAITEDDINETLEPKLSAGSNYQIGLNGALKLGFMIGSENAKIGAHIHARKFLFWNRPNVEIFGLSLTGHIKF